MKRNEVNAGDELYCARGRDWEANVRAGTKAIVVDAGNWRNPDTWSGSHEPVRTSMRSGGVLCDVYFRDFTGLSKVHHRRVVPLAHLRGPWADTLAQVEAAEALRVGREAVQQSAEDAARAAATAAVYRAVTAGYDSVLLHRWGSGTPVVTMSATDLVALLDAAGVGQ